MFEVGKLSDETMDSFITELEKVKRTNQQTLHSFSRVKERGTGDT